MSSANSYYRIADSRITKYLKIAVTWDSGKLQAPLFRGTKSPFKYDVAPAVSNIGPLSLSPLWGR